MYRVLVVEDETWIRRGIIKCISWEELGLELAGEAGNGLQALEMLDRESVDIVLTDMKMPVCDGKALLEGIEKRNLKCKIIILSEYTDFEYTYQAIHAHAIDYLLKPINPEQLNMLLKTACNKLMQERVTEATADPHELIFQAVISQVSTERFNRLCKYHESAFSRSNVIVSALQYHIVNMVPYKSISFFQQLTSTAPYPTRMLPYRDSENVLCAFTVVPGEYAAKEKMEYTVWLQGVIRSFYTYRAGDCRIGTTNGVCSIELLKNAANEALASLQFLHFGHGDIIHYDRVKKLKTSTELPAINEQQIIDLLGCCSKEEAALLRRSIINSIKAQDYCRRRPILS